MLIKTVSGLNIYQMASELSAEVEMLVKHVSFYWENVEVKQVIRSSSSVQANIAEGFSQRFYPKKFIHYLNIALGSSDESQNHLKKLKLNGKIDGEVGEDMIRKYKNLSVRILNFINYLRKRSELD